MLSMPDTCVHSDRDGAVSGCRDGVGEVHAAEAVVGRQARRRRTISMLTEAAWPSNYTRLRLYLATVVPGYSCTQG